MSLFDKLSEAKRRLKPTETTVTYLDGRTFAIPKNSTLPEEKQTKNYGYVVDSKPDDVPAKVLDHLYVGSQDCCAEEVLERHRIVNVLSVGIRPPCLVPGVSYTYLECLDIPETDLWDVVNKSASVIKSSVDKCENVLVHCNAGVSRSVSVVIGYLILVNGFNFVNAYEYIRTVRSCMRPNDGFIKQLKEYRS